jgi:hypothetical protein
MRNAFYSLSAQDRAEIMGMDAAQVRTKTREYSGLISEDANNTHGAGSYNFY